MKEIWKDVVGYEGLYQVSNIGRVRSLDHYANNTCCSTILYKGKVLSQYEYKGYMYTTVCKNNKSSKKLVHRLVAEAFIQNNFNKPAVNHKDGNKSNNAASNLEWCTYEENNNHAIRHGLRKLKIPKSEYYNIYLKNTSGISYKKLAKEYGVGKTKIASIIKEKRNEGL